MRVFAACAVAIAMFAGARFSLEAAPQVVSGVVVDSAGSGVAGAVVELKAGPRIERTTRTGTTGAFRFENVQEGIYEVRVRQTGFLEAVRAVTLGQRGVPSLRIALTPSLARGDAAREEAAAKTAQMADALRPPSSRPMEYAPPMAPMPAPFAGGVANSSISSVRMPRDFNTEAYAHIDEGGYRRVSENPLSTFSVDVDTASYANVRRFLNDGRLPPEDAVRVEELLNYFHYDYVAPKSSEPVAVTTEIASCPWNARHRLALVGLHTRPMDEGRTPPRNLVFLLDVSGSMNEPDKLPLVKTAMLMLTDTLTAEDRVAIVVYAGASGLALRSTPGDRKVAIKQAIEELSAGGSTNGAAGIKLAYDTATEHFVKGGINRVILATDGDFNVGVSSEGELTRLIEAERARGIFLSVLGVGTGNLKDSMMEKLADRGNGNYAYLDSVQEARRVLVAEAGATLVTVAKDVKIQVEFNPKRVGAYRLIGYENRALADADFNNDKKDAGEIGAGHSVTALYEIVPPGEDIDVPAVDKLKYQQPAATASRATDQSNELMTVKIRYKAPDGDISKQMAIAVADRNTPVTSNLGFAAAVAEFGMLLRKSEHKGQATWASARELARTHRGDDADGYRSEFLRLIDLASTLDRRLDRDTSTRR